MKLTGKAMMLVGALCVLLMTSCKTPTNITYMQGFEHGDAQVVRAQSRITFLPDDKISISVASQDPDLAVVFNNPKDFVVDPEGNIDYPILGTIHVQGLTRAQLAKKIKDALVAGNYLRDAVVTAELMNATISVLGDVGRPGEIPITHDNMNILQLIAKSGDLQLTGKRQNILVVREENGVDKAYRVDLTDTKSLMESPVFYLQQNDVVYVEPSDTKKRNSTTGGNTVFTPTFWISVASLLGTIAAIIVR